MKRHVRLHQSLRGDAEHGHGGDGLRIPSGDFRYSQQREILGEDEATFVLPCDPDSIASVINRLLGDSGESRWKALCAKERASRWAIPTMAERCERVYHEILGVAK